MEDRLLLCRRSFRLFGLWSALCFACLLFARCKGSLLWMRCEVKRKEKIPPPKQEENASKNHERNRPRGSANLCTIAHGFQPQSGKITSRYQAHGSVWHLYDLLRHAPISIAILHHASRQLIHMTQKQVRCKGKKAELTRCTCMSLPHGC